MRHSLRQISRLRAIAPIALLSLAACKHGVLAPAGMVAREERTILFDALAIMLAIVIPTIAAICLFAWHYRASNTTARYLPRWSYSGRLELITWSIPTLVILFLSGVIWTGSHRLDPGRPLESSAPPFEVQVVSLDWKWLFIYPQLHVAAVNELVIPVGRPVRLSLTSASVMNSFFVPRLGGMVATMNGMVTKLHLQAERPGHYYGLSTQFSGDGFPDMHFAVHVLPEDRFRAWSETQAHAGAPILDRASYLELARQSRDVRPLTYRLGDPGLFQSIANRAIPPAPGPADGPTAHSAHPQRGH